MECPLCGKQWEGKGLLCPQCAARNKEAINLARPLLRSDEQARSITGTLGSSPARVERTRPTSGTLHPGSARKQTAPSFGGQSGEESSLQAAKQAHPLSAGTLLQNGRYCLRVLQECQSWLNGTFEATWLAQDALHAGNPVTIREVGVPEKAAEARMALMRQATRSLLAMSTQSQLPTLTDTFSDQGRFFFVFEHVEGESLLARLQALKHFLDEAEVIQMCLQMSTLLETLAQQRPPLVHGLIDPRHILVSRSTASYLLTNPSILLAGQAAQWVAGTDRARLSPYMAPELALGTIDGRADIYSLLATASHLVRGSIPPRIQATHHLNPTVSTEFAALLFKGLHPLPGQRYQDATELRQALLALTPREKSHPRNQSKQADVLPLEAFIRSASVRQEELPPPKRSDSEETPHRLLPHPEELPPIPAGHDLRNATLWLVSILVVLSLIIFLAKGPF